MTYVLVVVAFAFGAYADGGAAVNVASIQFQTRAACETAAAFVREEFTLETRKPFYNVLKRYVRATCVMDDKAGT